MTGGPQAMLARPSKFIADRDLDFASQAEAFAKVIAKSPDRYNVSKDQSRKLTKLARQFRAALTLANDPDTRTDPTILRKKEERRKIEALVRSVAAVIRADKSISAVDKINLGIHERPARLRRKQCPKSPPVLRYLYAIDAVGSNRGRHCLEFAEMNASHTGKPRDAARLELFVELAPVGGPDDVPQHPCELSGRPWYMRSFRSSPIEVEYPVPMSGPMLVVYWACWADSKGNVGPFSKTCVARVEGWNADSAKALPGTHVHQLQRVEMKYVILQTPYVLPVAHLEDDDGLAHRMLPDQQANDMSRALEAAPARRAAVPLLDSA